MRSERMIRCLLAAAAVLFLPDVPARAEALLEALSDAYASNPRLLSARARLRATDEGVPLALSGWRPSVSVATGFDLDYSHRSGTVIQSADARLTLTQPLFRGLRTVAETERAENQVLAERARLTATEQTVLFDVVSAYMNVVRDRALLDLSTANVEVLRKQLEAVEDRFRVGELTRTDVAQAQSRLQRAIADQVNARGDLTTSIASYVNVVGHEPRELAFPPALTSLPQGEAQAIETARLSNPNVVAADYDERAAQSNVKLTTGELYPTLSLTGDVTYRTDLGAVEDIETLTETLGATLTVPLYLAGSVYARLRGTKQTASQRRQDLANAQRVAIQGATSAWENLQTALATVAAFEAEVRAQEIAYEGVQEEARVGARTTLDVLDAEQELFNSRVSLVRVRRDAVVSAYEVYTAIGRMTADDLGLSGARYDPRTYYDRVRNRWAGADIER